MGKAEELGCPIMGVFRSFAVVGLPSKAMGIGSTIAIPKVLEKVGLTVEDIDMFEINESFASQAMDRVKKLQIPIKKINVNGGAIALGHPYGCTGAHQIATLLPALKNSGGRFGVVSTSISSGMASAVVIEREL